MTILDARFGPVGLCSRRSKDVTIAVRKLVKDGKINWKHNHAHKIFGDPIFQMRKEVIIWYVNADGVQIKSRPFIETDNTSRSVHIILEEAPKPVIAEEIENTDTDAAVLAETVTSEQE